MAGPLSPCETERIAKLLLEAAASGVAIDPLRECYADLDIDGAYRVSATSLRLRQSQGAQHVGYKIGLTSTAARQTFNVGQPDYGFLTNDMAVADGVLERSRLIQPRLECELAFVLGSSLEGLAITTEEVIAATTAIVPAFEIVDSRISDWDVQIIDTVADNASAGAFVLGADRGDAGSVCSKTLECQLRKNGEVIARGSSANVYGSPAAAVTWLANTLAPVSPLQAGAIILSGTMTQAVQFGRGDAFELDIDGLSPLALVIA